MFGGKKEAHNNASERVDTIIGKETRFTGSVNANCSIRIDGYFEGEIVTKGELLIGEGGVVKATVNARNCVVAGEVHGDIVASQKLEIAPSGKVYGNIVADSLLIGEGAVFRGTCEMRKNLGPGEAAADSEA